MSRVLLIGDFSGGSAQYIAILSPPSSGEQSGNKTIEKMWTNKMLWNGVTLGHGLSVFLVFWGGVTFHAFLVTR